MYLDKLSILLFRNNRYSNRTMGVCRLLAPKHISRYITLNFRSYNQVNVWRILLGVSRCESGIVDSSPTLLILFSSAFYTGCISRKYSKWLSCQPKELTISPSLHSANLPFYVSRPVYVRTHVFVASAAAGRPTVSGFCRTSAEVSSR